MLTQCRSGGQQQHVAIGGALPLRARQPSAPPLCYGDPRHDLDPASPAIVKTLEGRGGDTYPAMTWEPKAAFAAVAERYRENCIRECQTPVKGCGHGDDSIP